jgi:DNA-binding XRE family transcriptional regulator
MTMANLSRTSASVFRETFPVMPTTKEDDRFNQWVARELKHLRMAWMDANEVSAKSEFAKRVGVDWKTIWNIEEQKHVPGVDMLHKIVTACDSNLAAFFALLITRMDMAAIERQNRDEAGWIETLVRGLSAPETRQAVEYYAATVRRALARIESQ